MIYLHLPLTGEPEGVAGFGEISSSHCRRFAGRHRRSGLYSKSVMVLEEPEVTGLLEAWSDGDPSALDKLVPIVFDDLHRMARFFFQRESATHTLQPTALVSEVYFRMRGQKTVCFESRSDFFNFAAEVMRHFLVDYARKRSAEKRGGAVTSVSLESGVAHLLSSTPTHARLLDLNLALEELERVSPKQAQIVTLRYFLGLQVKEVAELLEISESTVKREWRTAKYWLKMALKHQGSKEPSS